MSDDKNNRGPRDAERVNVHEDYEVRHWMTKWSVTEAQLKDAVRQLALTSLDETISLRDVERVQG